MLADVEIEQRADRASGGVHGLAERSDLGRIVGRDGERDTWEF